MHFCFFQYTMGSILEANTQFSFHSTACYVSNGLHHMVIDCCYVSPAVLRACNSGKPKHVYSWTHFDHSVPTFSDNVVLVTCETKMNSAQRLSTSFWASILQSLPSFFMPKLTKTLRKRISFNWTKCTATRHTDELAASTWAQKADTDTHYKTLQVQNKNTGHQCHVHR